MPEIRHKAEIYVNYDEAQTRQNLSSGEEIRTVFGKIKKWFADMGTAAFKDVPSSGDAENSEVVLGNDSRLSDARTPTAHTQAANTITAMTGYTKPQSTAAVSASDTLNGAIGKLEKALDGKGTSNFSGDYADLSNKPTLGTAAVKDVPANGNALTSQVVMGNDTRLSDSRPASDVSSWAKASTKPTYTASEVGAAPESHTQASSTITSMTGYSKPQSTSAIAATDTLNEAIGKLEKGLDGAGTPNDGVLTIQQNGTTIGTFSANQVGNTTVNIEAAPAPYIISNAVNSDDGTSVVVNSFDVGITDTINYSNLFAGETYTLKTKVYDTVTQTYLSITKNGTSSTEIASTITPSTNSGSYTNVFSIDNLADASNNTVLNVVEILYYHNEAISIYTSNVTVDATLSSWELLQAKVRDNKMSNISIGDQFVCSYGDSTLTWDVIGKNQDTPSSSSHSNSLTLRIHNLLSGLIFDASEAFYYCSSALSPGNYYWGWGNSFRYFSLTKPVPVGGQLTLYTPGNGTYTVTSWTSATGSYLETVSVNSGSSGTYLGTIQNDTTNGDLNTYYRAIQGSNNYAESAIRQYLNSNKPAGEWWTPQNKWDRPPSFASTKNGFLFDLDPEFVKVVGLTDKITVKALPDGSGSYTTSDLFFLLSRTEVYGGDEGFAEGQPYEFYSENSSLSTAGTGNDNNRKMGTNYDLRTPKRSESGRFYQVNSSGGIDFYNSPSGSGYYIIACNII